MIFAYVVRRLIGAVPTLLILLVLTSVSIRLVPGNAADVILADSFASPEDRARVEEGLGLNVSPQRQFFDYLRRLASGSLGESLWTGETVVQSIALALPPTLELTGLAAAVSVLIGVPIGMLGAVRRNRPEDVVTRGLVLLVASVPNFVLATAVVILPAYYFSWTPPLRYVAFTDSPLENLKYFALPAFVLGGSMSAYIARFARTSMLEVLQADYVRTARSKGLRERIVIGRHAFRNALIPVITTLGAQAAGLFGGAVVVEQVFGIPGVGRLLLDQIATRDYPMVQGITLVIGSLVILVNLTVDISYAVIDPRIRLSGAS